MYNGKANRDSVQLIGSSAVRGAATSAHVPPAVAGVPPSSLSNALQRHPRNLFHLHDETERRISLIGRQVETKAKHRIAWIGDISLATG